MMEREQIYSDNISDIAMEISISHVWRERIFALKGGEVWSAREAILNGAKFDELTFQSINASNGAAKELCKNCQKTFEGHY